MNEKMEKQFDDFQKYYEKHIDEVFGFILVRVNYQRELAEDLVSEIFMKALEKFDTFSEEQGRFKSWIFKIAKNHLIDYFRANASKETIDLDSVINISDKDDPARKTRLKFETEALKEVIKNLSEKKQEIIIMHYIMGYSYQEISEILGLNENKIRVMAHRTLKELKNKLFELKYEKD